MASRRRKILLGISGFVSPLILCLVGIADEEKHWSTVTKPRNSGAGISKFASDRGMAVSGPRGFCRIRALTIRALVDLCYGVVD